MSKKLEQELRHADYMKQEDYRRIYRRDDRIKRLQERIAELEADRDDQAVKNYEQAKRIAALEKLSVKAAAIHAKTGGEYATGWRDACAWIAQSTRAPEQGDE